MGLVATGRRPCRIVVDCLLIDQTFLLHLIRHLHPARGLVTPPHKCLRLSVSASRPLLSQTSVYGQSSICNPRTKQALCV